MSAVKDQTIKHLMNAIGAEDHEMSAVMAFAGEDAYLDAAGQPIALWTYPEMLEVANAWLDGQAEGEE